MFRRVIKRKILCREERESVLEFCFCEWSLLKVLRGRIFLVGLCIRLCIMRLVVVREWVEGWLLGGCLRVVVGVYGRDVEGLELCIGGVEEGCLRVLYFF